MCGNKREGLEVLPDYMIGIIRWFKHLTRSEKRYRLVVCRECFENYSKARRRYRRKQIEYLAVGVLFAALLAAFNPIPGIIYGIAIIAFMYLLSQLSWMPALRMPETKKKEQRK
jgi:hypothetical protein